MPIIFLSNRTFSYEEFIEILGKVSVNHGLRNITVHKCTIVGIPYYCEVFSPDLKRFFGFGLENAEITECTFVGDANKV